MDPYREQAPSIPSAFKPLEVAASDIQVLPQAMWNASCSSCSKLLSKWNARMSRREFELAIVCSACFLYKSDWGKANQVELKKFVREVEKEMGRRLQVDGQDRLVGTDADRIIYGIVQESRIVQHARKNA